MKRASLSQVSLVFIGLVFALASFSPFRGTRLENSSKLNNWWKEVTQTRYGKVDFSTFSFVDLKSITGSSDRLLYERCQKLLKKLPPYARYGKWLAVFDNRRQFCGLLSENRIVAQAGVKKGDEVYVNMFLNTRHLPSATYLVDNIYYYTDGLGRIKRVFCPDLQLKSRGRNQFSQRYSVKFKDGVRGDNCGHLIPQALDGPAEQILATATQDGRVKGFIANPECDLPLNDRGKLDVGGSLGVGNLTVIKDLGLKEPYVGTIALVDGEIADDLTAYYYISEQQNTAISLGVKVDTDWSIKAAGGMFIQMLPRPVFRCRR